MPVGIGLIVRSPWVANSDRHVRASVRLACAGAVVLQLGTLAYNPAGSIPSAADRAGGEHLLEELAAIDGEVLLPSQRYVQTRVGIPSFGLEMAAADVLRSDPQDSIAAKLRRTIDDAVESERFAAIVLDQRDAASFSPHMAEHYVLKQQLFHGDEYFPVTGAPSRPNWLFVRRTR